jgi:hypothetical protein
MEKPKPGRQARTSPSITSVLKVISDEKALVLFNNIVVSDNNGFISLKKINLSPRQYYSKISGFQKTGLIKRRKGQYIPTLLGKAVYDSQMVIEEALSHYWKLKFIDEIETSHSDLSIEDVKRLINDLIDNHRIKDVLMKQANVASVEANLKFYT